jgi:hypothetical protein
VGEKTILHGAFAGRQPYIQGARFERTLDGPTLSLNVECPDGAPEPLGLEVTGRNAYKLHTRKTGSRVGDIKTLPKCGRQDVHVNLDDLELLPGEVAYFEITLRIGEDSSVYRYDQLYDPWRWFIDHRNPFIVSTVVLMTIATFGLFLCFRPLWNLRLYQFLRLAQIDKASAVPVVGSTLQAVLKLCTIGLPWFVTNPRTLDAWVSGQSNLIEQQWGQETLTGAAGDSSHQRAIESTCYVPLPIRLADRQFGSVIPEPSAAEISSLFSGKRTVIEVIGPGGAGKTTLARQIGRWCLLGGRPTGFPQHAVIPIWVDEDMSEKEKPLVEVIKGKLAALLPEQKLDDAFLEALLKKQRLLVILDRLSERSAATQQYMGTIYRSARPEALLITARVHVPVSGSKPVFVYPQALNKDTLLHFMTSLLRPGASENEDGNAQVTLSLDDQLAIGSKLAVLYQTSIQVAGEAPILPLPVRLFVEEAKRLIRAGLPLDTLPLSIPEVYSRYLEQVNPNEPSLPNFMTPTEMLRAATVLAKLALTGDFVPKEFYDDEAATALRQSGWADPQKLDPVRRLIDNGILIQKGPLVSRRLQFALDPIAEFLAATSWVRECGNGAGRLDNLRASAAGSPSFLAAIDLVNR